MCISNKIDYIATVNIKPCYRYVAAVDKSLMSGQSLHISKLVLLHVADEIFSSNSQIPQMQVLNYTLNVNFTLQKFPHILMLSQNKTTNVWLRLKVKQQKIDTQLYYFRNSLYYIYSLNYYLNFLSSPHNTASIIQRILSQNRVCHLITPYAYEL